jgi:hypothetical protein
VLLPDAANLRAGLQALRLGVPLEELLGVYREVRDDTDRLARRFAALVEANVWRPLLEGDATEEERARARDAVAELASSTVAVVAATMREAVVRVAREVAARYGQDIDDLLDGHADGPPA